MEKKGLDFDLKSVVYTKETKVMDYHSRRKTEST